ncbi:MAG: hypothetical protein WBF43_08575, partial [Methylocella sp.]
KKPTHHITACARMMGAFACLMNAANHRLRHEALDGIPRQFRAMPYGARSICGVTAGISRNLYERLYS